MKIYDISLPISSELITWPGDPRPQLDKVLSISEGDACNVTKLEMGVHTGTHIDSPNHFIEGGITTDSMQLEVLMGKCLVIEITSKSNVQVSDLCDFEIGKYERLLLKTKNSVHWENDSKKFDKNFQKVSIYDSILLMSFWNNFASFRPIVTKKFSFTLTKIKHVFTTIIL